MKCKDKKDGNLQLNMLLCLENVLEGMTTPAQNRTLGRTDS